MAKTPLNTGQAGERWLERGITLPHAIGLLLGYIIGASIFVLVGPLAASVGPGLFVSYALAAVPALLVCLYNIQLGAVLPTTGANYVVASRVLSPFAGFLSNWAMLVATFFGVPVLAWGFGIYLAQFVPGIPPMAGAIGIVVVLGTVNVLGVRIAAWVQSLMVLMFVAALALFIVGGLPHIDPALQQPLFPNGFGAVVITAISAYFSYIGFTVITEVAGEIREPRRNIPRALIVSFLIVLLIYTSTSYVFTGVMDWREAGQSAATLTHAAARFLPPGLVTFIGLGALFAAATTIHGVLMTSSRDVLMLGHDGVLPAVFGRVHPRLRTPVAALVLLIAVSCAGVAMGFTLDQYALLTVLGLMVVHIISSTAVFLLPSRRPDLWQRASIQFSTVGRWFTWIGVLAVSIFFLVVGSAEVPSGALLFAALMLAGVVYWYARRAYLAARDINLEARMATFGTQLEQELSVD